MNIVDEYMLNRFPQVKGDNKGKLETDTQYKARICWYRNGYPSSEKLEELCGTKQGTIDNYRSLFDWKSIKEHAINLQTKQDQIDLRNRQKEIEERHRERNKKLGAANEDYLDQLLYQLENEWDSLTKDEQSFLMYEIRATRKELSSIQRDERTTEHLPNSYKDITGDINVDGNMDIQQDVKVNLLEKVKQKRRELNDLRSNKK